jgi:hypothetical protein
MTTYVLEMRSTANWQDVRYREYTTSAKKAEIFKGVPKIQFTDSGHGIVPHVREKVKGPREPRNMMLGDHVQDYIKAVGRQVRPKMPPIPELLEQALKPFVDAYTKHADQIGDSDLYDEQPRSVHVTLGDCRRAHLLLLHLRNERASPLSPADSRPAENTGGSQS